MSTLSQFVSSLNPSTRLGLGTLLLTTSADYTDRDGRAFRFLDEIEEYCRQTADLTVHLTAKTPGIPEFPEFNGPTDWRGLLVFNIRIAREELARGKYPDLELRNITSLHQRLSLALGRYTRSGVKHRKNHKAPRQSDRLVTMRNEWIRKRFSALLGKGIDPTRASKCVEQELSKLVEFHRVTIGDRQIRNICQPGGIGVGSRGSPPKKH